MTARYEELKRLPDKKHKKLSAGQLVMEQMLPDWRSKKDKLINDAVRLIVPLRQRRDACLEDVAKTTLHIAFANAFLRGQDQVKTKQGKKAVGQLAVALWRVEAALENKELDSALRAIARMRFPSERVRELARCCEDFEAARTGKLIRKGAKAKVDAVEHAMRLMIEYATPQREADNIKKGSRFCKLAALLFGSPAADLSNQCKAAASKARKQAG